MPRVQRRCISKTFGAWEVLYLRKHARMMAAGSTKVPRKRVPMHVYARMHARMHACAYRQSGRGCGGEVVEWHRR